eukprot:TRINITY_DN29000_c0_g1_i2.p1 TRINITY_DN29000_c0_g1~~TRINITY_DN29000_c0_g1_i2.p1  ORF type:complete len:163 (+),score=34.24 TRINITY_DN29000_c0_g1_i2:102-590(+)
MASSMCITIALSIDVQSCDQRYTATGFCLGTAKSALSSGSGGGIGCLVPLETNAVTPATLISRRGDGTVCLLMGGVGWRCVEWRSVGWRSEIVCVCVCVCVCVWGVWGLDLCEGVVWRVWSGACVCVSVCVGCVVWGVCVVCVSYVVCVVFVRVYDRWWWCL